MSGLPTPSAEAAESADQRLAQGFAQHVERWVLALSRPAALARATGQAARELSLATADGHVCIALGDLTPLVDGPADARGWRQLLLSSGICGTHQAPGSMPLVLDADDRLYLHRHFDDERRLAQRLMRASGGAPRTGLDLALPRLQQRLNQLYAGTAGNKATTEGPDWQKLAAALALRGRLSIISGGPGTGKTTTVVNLLACLIELDPDCRIVLAAPTGKAAARMSEAIRQSAAHLPEALRARLPAQAATVHRLLGATSARGSGAGGFTHHAGNPLPIDALVVDEASMLDLALATRLLEAVPETARIVLLGDKDQLAAVESGAVFSELSVDPTLSDACIQDLARLTGIAAAHVRTPTPVAPSALRDSVVWLTRNFRFAPGSGIGRLAALINVGQAAQALAWLGAGDGSGGNPRSDPALRWLDDTTTSPLPQTLQHMLAGYATYFDAVRRDPTDPGAIHAAFARFRVLCAVREGPRGVAAVNAQITRHCATALGVPAGHAPTWYPGRPVLVLRNDHVLKLFNGDIGIALPDAAGELMVQFPDQTGGSRAIAPVRLPPHETAFATTVHKAQGSEFDQVLILLPVQRSRVLTRELLYTAVTRARSGVTLCGGSATIAEAIATTTQRRSGLLARLRECQLETGGP